MVPVYSESVRRVVELCCELLAFAHNAHSSESLGETNIMTYTLISDCASRIQAAAEQGRWERAKAQW